MAGSHLSRATADGRWCEFDPEWSRRCWHPPNGRLGPALNRRVSRVLRLRDSAGGLRRVGRPSHRGRRWQKAWRAKGLLPAADFGSAIGSLEALNGPETEQGISGPGDGNEAFCPVAGAGSDSAGGLPRFEAGAGVDVSLAGSGLSSLDLGGGGLGPDAGAESTGQGSGPRWPA
jgi:hypothetical protein